MIDVCWRQVLHLLLGDAQPDAIVDPRHGTDTAAVVRDCEVAGAGQAVIG
jgi:hypothetical protein